MRKIRNILKSVFVQQVGTTAISQVAALILSMVTSAITARWLGPAGKGALAMVFMVPGSFQIFLCVGLTTANTYYVGSGRMAVHQLSENSVAFSLLGTLIGFMFILPFLEGDLLGTYLPGISPDYLLLGMLALPLGLLNANLNAILLGLRRILTLNVLNVAKAALSIVFMAVFLIWLDFGILGAIFALLAGQVVMFWIIAFCTKREGAGFRPRWDRNVAKKTLSYGIKIYIGNLLQFFNYRLDLFIVNYFLGPSGVGIYGVSVTLAELLWQLPNAASVVLFPKSANSSHAEMNSFTPRVFCTVFCVTVLGAIGLAIFGRYIILFVFSSTFLDSYTPLLVLLPGVVFLGTAKILTSDIAGRGYPQYNSITAGFSLVITLIFDFLLIPRMGAVGAALASTLSYIATFVLSIVFYISVARQPHIETVTTRI